jgi:hypothetical protein
VSDDGVALHEAKLQDTKKAAFTNHLSGNCIPVCEELYWKHCTGCLTQCGFKTAICVRPVLLSHCIQRAQRVTSKHNNSYRGSGGGWGNIHALEHQPTYKQTNKDSMSSNLPQSFKHMPKPDSNTLKASDLGPKACQPLPLALQSSWGTSHAKSECLKAPPSPTVLALPE